MAERKSVNKYYPPDWDPSKGSVNKYVGQHPLRDRAKKLGQGILVIRFEMPYNIWCGGCNNPIGMGVRYNAEKSKVGKYYTTPIYKFRMKCHLCDNYFEIQTDPKNHDYVILEGARRKEQRWDPKENEQIVPEDKATQKKMATDAMFKLEHGTDDVQRSKKTQTRLSNLEMRKEDMKDDYMLNKLARNKFREEKKAIRTNLDIDAALLSKSSLEIPLLKESETDKKLAALMKYRAVESFEEKTAQKRREIESQPIFTTNKKQKLDSETPSKLDIIKKQLRASGPKLNPFDSTKMDTIGLKTSAARSQLMKHSLGIRKKSLNADKPFIATKVVDSNFSTNMTMSADDEMELAAETEGEADEAMGDNSEDIRDYSCEKETYRDDNTEDTENSPVCRSDSEISGSISQSSDDKCRSYEPSGDKGICITQQTSSVNLEPSSSIEIESQLKRNCLNTEENVLTDNVVSDTNAKTNTEAFKDTLADTSLRTDSDLKNNDQTAADTVNVRSGLNLLCSYSDSDTDSSAS